MPYTIFVPEEPLLPQVPRGAAVLGAARGRYLVCSSTGVPFGERCAQALQAGRVLSASSLPGAQRAGTFDETEGEIWFRRGEVAILQRWLGHRLCRDDLLARDNRQDRRAEARRCLLQGRVAEAWMHSKDFGL